MAIGLVADIGGTNARFALVDSAAPLTLQDPQTLKCADYPTITEAARAYLSEIADTRIERAVLAVAGPLTGDIFVQNNGPWRFSISALGPALDITTLDVVNDFMAMAHGIAVLPENRFTAIASEITDASKAGPWLVSGPGTGLGVATILEPHGDIRVLESEGGHIGLAPSNAEEIEIAREVLRRFPMLPWERLVSGPGLVILHDVMAKLDGRTVEHTTPEEIARDAIDGKDAFSIAVLEQFCRFLGSAAGDMALAVKARRVCLVGGIVETILPFLQSSGFRARFEDRGRYADVLDPVPTLAVSGTDVGLIGAAALLGRARQGPTS
jgi:glucokinase